MSSKICVAVRKRPGDEKDVVIAHSTECIVNEPKVKYDLTPYTERHTFVYDDVFDEHCGNREVYQRCCQPLIDTLFSYGNATCFAYGQTGSGKTHTMLGHGDEPGLYACAAKDVFSRCKAINAEVFASFYEIYGRKLFDLLSERKKLVAREDANKEIVICGLTEHPVKDVADLFNIISAGSAYRAAGATSANADSSRSHAVLQMEVREKAGKTVGRISFIDLAGNERGADTSESDRKTRMEGAEINKSLLALKECIRALGMGKSHVPFRGSVLTEVLRDSFLGNSRTTMIATISPISAHCENTLNTLRYTQRVKDLGGASGGGRQQIIEEKPRRAVEPKAGRRKPFGNAPVANRPEWVVDDEGKSPTDGFGNPPLVRNRNNGAPRSAPAKRNVVVKDPRIATIVACHINDLEDSELSPTDEDDDSSLSSPAGDPGKLKDNKEVIQVRAVHAHVVRAINKAEDEIMEVHRKHIDNKMIGIKGEIKAIQALDDKDSVDDYVSKVRDILTKQRRDIDSIMERLGSLQNMLKDEEDLGRTLRPAIGKGGGAGNAVASNFKPNYGR